MIAAVVNGILSWLMFRGNGDLLVPNLIPFVLVIQRLNLRLLRLGPGLNRLAENSVACKRWRKFLILQISRFAGGEAYPSMY